MNTNLIDPAQWAQNEFGFAQLGDQRRNKRLVNIAEHLAANPGGTLPQAFPEWAELKAAYRFLDSAESALSGCWPRIWTALGRRVPSPESICSLRTPPFWITAVIIRRRAWE